MIGSICYGPYYGMIGLFDVCQYRMISKFAFDYDMGSSFIGFILDHPSYL